MNMTICGSLLIGRAIIKVVFGELWPMESQVCLVCVVCFDVPSTNLSYQQKHMYDRMLNFLLFKVIFIGAVMEPVWRHILRLSMWIGVLGFMRIFSLLSRDRLDNVRSDRLGVECILTISLVDNCGIRLAQKILQNHSVFIDHPFQ